MSAPKATIIKTKSGKVEVTYEKNFDAANYYIFELTRAALRDVAKFVCKKFRETYYQTFKRHTGDAGRSTSYKVYSGKNTIYPRVDIGLKTGQVDGFYAYFQEFGTADGRVPRLGILQNVVHDNVDTIKKIESQYLSALDNGSIDGLIDESETEGDGDEI